MRKFVDANFNLPPHRYKLLSCSTLTLNYFTQISEHMSA